MRSSSVVLASFSALLALGCSGGEGGAPGSGGAPTGDARAFVPEGLPNTEVGDQPGGLTLVAFTLEQATGGVELYAAVKNEGTKPACSIGLMIEFYDQAEQLMTSVGGTVATGQFYLLDDGSGAVLSCLPPGKVGMAGVVAADPALVFDRIGSVKHNFPAFEVGGTFMDGVGIGKLTTSSTSGASTYTGTLTNGLDVALGAPIVTVFPVNRVGRPLGAATSAATMDVPAGGTWTFETTGVDDVGVGYVAYAGGSPALPPAPSP